MKLYFNPMSSYSQKVLVAFGEKGVPFSPEVVNVMDPAGRAEYLKLNPFGKIPVLVLDNGQLVRESTIIIEYLEDHFPTSGTRLIPADKERAREARLQDRFFDHYVNDPMQKVFFDGMKPEAERDPRGVAAARKTLDAAYAIADEYLANKTWLLGDEFTIGDCAAAPALGYARMVHPLDQHRNLAAYVGRLSERPSFARVLADVAPILAKVFGVSASS
jgi:glutathione S-transferase